MADEERKAVIEAQSINAAGDPQGAPEKAIVTTAPLPTGLRITLVLCATFVASLALILYVFFDLERSIFDWACGFALLIFGTSNTSIGNAISGLVAWIQKRGKK